MLTKNERVRGEKRNSPLFILGYPLNLSILLSGGIEINRDSVSNGE